MITPEKKFVPQHHTVKPYEIMRFKPDAKKWRTYWRVYRNGEFMQTFDRLKDAKRWIQWYENIIR